MATFDCHINVVPKRFLHSYDLMENDVERQRQQASGGEVDQFFTSGGLRQAQAFAERRRGPLRSLRAESGDSTAGEPSGETHAPTHTIQVCR